MSHTEQTGKHYFVNQKSKVALAITSALLLSPHFVQAAEAEQEAIQEKEVEVVTVTAQKRIQNV